MLEWILASAKASIASKNTVRESLKQIQRHQRLNQQQTNQQLLISDHIVHRSYVSR